MRSIVLAILLSCCGWLPIICSSAGQASTNELWCLKPVTTPLLPAVRNPAACRNPIDYFIRHQLDKKDLSFNPEADRRVLIRRLTLGLHGVPPTPEEIENFVRDPAPGAYESLVDRLLASPRYGERWARHWLDVVRYTESQGFEYDHLRPNAWHYRDYVIGSFNSDKPYDLFIREQIAGDVINPDSVEGLIATSLLVCGAWDQAGSSQANITQRTITREEELEDLIAALSQGILGITVNCARCHSHKFDPVPLADYYRMKAVFEGVRHGERTIATPAEIAAHEARIAAVKEQFPGKTEAEKELKKISALPVSYVGVRKQPEPTRILNRGDVNSPGDEVRPGGLSMIAQLPSDFGLAPGAPEAERRIKFAQWVSHPRNPLTPRVLANRVWMHHFGQGIVSTPSDFGNAGAKPTHPELLDWLAAQLVRQGWSIKSLHRLILCSATYRQTSAYNSTAAQIDSDNQLLWRFQPRRLEAEAIRDSILAASGSMNWQMGGPSFRPFDIISFNSSTYIPLDKSGPEFDRRTIYRANVNSGKDPLLDGLDCPDPSIKTPRRLATITPLQALSLMNNPFVQRQAEQLAKRVAAETQSTEAAFTRAFQYTLGRTPSALETAAMLPEAKERGLSHICWVLFNSTEFLYVQ